MRFKNAQVLVTGGAGFVGSNLVIALVREGAKVRVVDNFFTGSVENIQEVLNEVELIRASVRSREAMEKALEGVDYVFHLATVNIQAAVKYPELEMETNVGGTVNLLNLCKNLPVKRFVYTSSVSIYGQQKDFPIKEDAPPILKSFYPAGKYAGEAYCFAFHHHFGLPITILRYSNVYGPRQSPSNPYSGVVSKFLNSALRGEKIVIHGDGKQTRDFVYIEDAVEATLRSALEPQAIGEVFNIASGKETSIEELAGLIISMVNNSLEIEYVEPRQIDYVKRRVLDIQKAQRLLGWSPKTDLREGLKKTYEWMLGNGKSN
ncbi:NAD-dependent epimerase/dehydratase family protein [bacterium]|nr:NAD-dependent epimerase/dehydratase family protein [bacterium]